MCTPIFSCRSLRVVEGMNVEGTIAPCYKDVSRSVIGTGRICIVEALRHAHHHIAGSPIQRFPEELFALRKPEIAHLHAEVFRYYIGEPVLETLLRLIGVRKVIGVRTNAQYGCCGCSADSGSEITGTETTLELKT